MYFVFERKTRRHLVIRTRHSNKTHRYNAISALVSITNHAFRLKVVKHIECGPAMYVSSIETNLTCLRGKFGSFLVTIHHDASHPRLNFRINF